MTCGCLGYPRRALVLRGQDEGEVGLVRGEVVRFEVGNDLFEVLPLPESVHAVVAAATRAAVVGGRRHACEVHHLEVRSLGALRERRVRRSRPRPRPGPPRAPERPGVAGHRAETRRGRRTAGAARCCRSGREPDRGGPSTRWTRSGRSPRRPVPGRPRRRHGRRPTSGRAAWCRDRPPSRSGRSRCRTSCGPRGCPNKRARSGRGPGSWSAPRRGGPPTAGSRR